VEAHKLNTITSTVVLSHRFTERRANAARAHARESAPGLAPGDRLGRYTLLERLGDGGMGVVYKAHDAELQRIVALKVLPPDVCRHPDHLQRFRAEAQAHARLNHPNVLTLYSLMELSAGEVLVLEYVEGQTLAQLLRSQGPLPVSEAVRLFVQVLEGVAHIHRRSVVHRDLKPSNLFVTQDGIIKIMDFGVAKLLDNSDAAQHATMAGTLLYMAPEQINSRGTDYRSDIYTLGVTLYETITGRLPFERRTDFALMHAHVQESPPRPKHYARRVPPELEWVILKAIEKDPARRFQTVSEFRVALLKLGLIERRQRDAEVIQAAGTPHERDMRRYGLHQRGPWIGGLGFDAALVATAAFLLWNLGVVPTPSTVPSMTPLAQTKPVAVKTAQIAKRAPVARPAVRKTAVTPPPAPTKAASRDRYDVVRDAWGS